MICFVQAEDGIRDLVRSRGLGDVYKRQDPDTGMFGVFDARQFVVPDSPSKADAEAALVRLSLSLIHI